MPSLEEIDAELERRRKLRAIDAELARRSASIPLQAQARDRLRGLRTEIAAQPAPTLGERALASFAETPLLAGQKAIGETAAGAINLARRYGAAINGEEIAPEDEFIARPEIAAQLADARSRGLGTSGAGAVEAGLGAGAEHLNPVTLAATMAKFALTKGPFSAALLQAAEAMLRQQGQEGGEFDPVDIAHQAQETSSAIGGFHQAGMLPTRLTRAAGGALVGGLPAAAQGAPPEDVLGGLASGGVISGVMGGKAQEQAAKEQARAQEKAAKEQARQQQQEALQAQKEAKEAADQALVEGGAQEALRTPGTPEEQASVAANVVVDQAAQAGLPLEEAAKLAQRAHKTVQTLSKVTNPPEPEVPEAPKPSKEELDAQQSERVSRLNQEIPQNPAVADALTSAARATGNEKLASAAENVASSHRVASPADVELLEKSGIYPERFLEEAQLDRQSREGIPGEVGVRQESVQERAVEAPSPEAAEAGRVLRAPPEGIPQVQPEPVSVDPAIAEPAKRIASHIEKPVYELIDTETGEPVELRGTPHEADRLEPPRPAEAGPIQADEGSLGREAALPRREVPQDEAANLPGAAQGGGAGEGALGDRPGGGRNPEADRLSQPEGPLGAADVVARPGPHEAPLGEGGSAAADRAVENANSLPPEQRLGPGAAGAKMTPEERVEWRKRVDPEDIGARISDPKARKTYKEYTQFLENHIGNPLISTYRVSEVVANGRSEIVLRHRDTGRVLSPKEVFDLANGDPEIQTLYDAPGERSTGARLSKAGAKEFEDHIAQVARWALKKISRAVPTKGAREYLVKAAANPSLAAVQLRAILADRPTWERSLRNKSTQALLDILPADTTATTRDFMQRVVDQIYHGRAKSFEEAVENVTTPGTEVYSKELAEWAKTADLDSVKSVVPKLKIQSMMLSLLHKEYAGEPLEGATNKNDQRAWLPYVRARDLAGTDFFRRIGAAAAKKLNLSRAEAAHTKMKRAGYWIVSAMKVKPGGAIDEFTRRVGTKEEALAAREEAVAQGYEPVSDKNFTEGIAEPIPYNDRVLNGMLSDISLTYANGIDSHIGLLGKSRALNHVVELALSPTGRDIWRPSSDPRPPDWVKVSEIMTPDSKKIVQHMASSRDLPAINRFYEDGYASPELAEAIHGLYGEKGLFGQLFGGYEGSVRRGKVVYNPARYVMQPQENVFAQSLDSMPLALRSAAKTLDYRTWNDLRQLIRDSAEPDISKIPEGRREKQQLFNDLIVKSGIEESDFISAEGWGARTGISVKEINKLLGDGSWIEKTVAKIKTSKTGLKAAEFDAKLNLIYHMQDLYYKWEAAKFHTERGMSAQDTIQRIRDFYMDFSQMPMFVKKVAKVVPYAPPVAYNTFRILYNHMFHYGKAHAANVGLKLGLMGGLPTLLTMAFGSHLTDEERRSLGSSGPKTWKVGPIDTGVQSEFTRRGDDGKTYVFDMSRPMFAADLASMNAPRGTGDMTLAESVMRSGPAGLQPVVDVITGHNRFGGDIAKEGEVESVKNLRVASEALGDLLPYFLWQWEAAQIKNAYEDREQWKKPWWVSAGSQFHRTRAIDEGAVAGMLEKKEKRDTNAKKRMRDKEHGLYRVLQEAGTDDSGGWR